MPLTLVHVVIVAAVLTLAGVVHGAAGFGFGLTALGLLAGLLPLKEASVTLVLAALGLNLAILLRLRKHVTLDRLKGMLAGPLVGVPLGVWVLVQADEGLLRRTLGIILLATVAQPLIPALRAKRWHPVWVGVPCGLLSGALSGAFATGGPPAVAYVQSQQFDRFRYAAGVQMPLAIAAVVRIACLGVSGLFTRQLLVLSAMGIVCAVAGSWIGLHALKRLPDPVVRKVALGMLLVLGIRYLVWS